MEQPCQRKEFFYDTNPFDAAYSQNIQGRLAAVRYKSCNLYQAPYSQTFLEMYSYTPGGLTTKKRFRVERSPGGNGDLDGVWTYDSEGKMTSVAIPKSSTYSYGYDSMGRVYSMNRDGEGPVVNGIGYGPAGELMTMVKGGALYENRTYNDRLQLRTLQVGTRNITYNYGAGGTNNGQIVSQVEDGETIAYQYDELKRLASASATGAMTWTQSYNYDGFGNLVSMGASGNGGGGGPTAGSQVINPATNKPFSGYSAAGLPNFGGWDNDNRMVVATGPGSNPEYLAYSPSGKRVWNQGVRLVDPFTQETVQEVWFWSPQGQRLAFYSLSNTGAPVFTFQSANLYMGGKLINQPTDRLGSVGKFYPYGAERNPTGQSGEKFATYFHDANVGLYYADQRWHGTWGRFATPDPYQASGGPADPGSWNRYAYTWGDPINNIDPEGTTVCYNLGVFVFCFDSVTVSAQISGGGGPRGGGGGGVNLPSLEIGPDGMLFLFLNNVGPSISSGSSSRGEMGGNRRGSGEPTRGRVGNDTPTVPGTYACRSTLHVAPFDRLGPTGAGPLRHDYLCTLDGQGNWTCGGQGPSGNPFGSPGANDSGSGFTRTNCALISTNSALTECVDNRLQDPDRGYYDVTCLSGVNCQRWARDVRSACGLNPPSTPPTNLGPDGNPQNCSLGRLLCNN
ncbi:MAG: hypothetical protein K2X35_16585 [Bryobacteraceae bacterium]|nr:hypothetical protein [Bryobacteraceae bacterium]